MLGAQAAHADVDPFLHPIYGHSGLAHVGQPAAVGVSLGMTNIVAELGLFTTNIALGQFLPL